MSDDRPGSDSKLIERAADRVMGRAGWIAAGTMFSIVIALITAIAGAAHWFISREFEGVRYEMRQIAGALDAQRKSDVDRIELQLQRHLEEVKPLRDRLTQTERTTVRNEVLIDRHYDRLNQMAADLAEIKTRLRGDRDRNEERPAPPVDLGGRIPMLWHF